MYLDKPITAYIEDLAAHKAAPGGGSASALMAAVAGALCSMTANFTTGEKYRDAATKVERILRDCKAATADCLKMVDEDVIAYNAIERAQGLPRATDAEKAARTAAMQEALKGATKVPMALFRGCAELLRLLGELVEICNPNLITDAGVSAYAAYAAMHGARLNAEINCKCIKDEAFVSKVSVEIAETLTECAQLYAGVTAKVDSVMRAKGK